MAEYLPTVETIVADLLEHSPDTIAAFQKHGMACVGCPFARFTTLREAAQVYHLDLSTFLSDLEQATAVSHRAGRRGKQRNK